MRLGGILVAYPSRRWLSSCEAEVRIPNCPGFTRRLRRLVGPTSSSRGNRYMCPSRKRFLGNPDLVKTKFIPPTGSFLLYQTYQTCLRIHYSGQPHRLPLPPPPSISLAERLQILLLKETLPLASPPSPLLRQCTIHFHYVNYLS